MIRSTLSPINHLAGSSCDDPSKLCGGPGCAGEFPIGHMCAERLEGAIDTRQGDAVEPEDQAISDPLEGGHITADRGQIAGCRVDENLPSPEVEAGTIDVAHRPARRERGQHVRLRRLHRRDDARPGDADPWRRARVDQPGTRANDVRRPRRYPPLQHAPSTPDSRRRACSSCGSGTAPRFRCANRTSTASPGYSTLTTPPIERCD